MFDISEWLTTPSNVLTIILFIIGIVVTFVVSFYIARRYTPKPNPVYEEYAIRIIEEKTNILPKDVKIFYGDKNVPRLSKYFIIFWNNGHVNLEGSSIHEKDPLMLEFDSDTEIYEVNTISPLKPTIDLKYNYNKNIVNLSFDDLEPNEGFNLEILHTGKNRYPTLHGSFRNIQGGVKNLGKINQLSNPKRPKVFKYLPFTDTSYKIAIIVLTNPFIGLFLSVFLLIIGIITFSLNPIIGIFIGLYSLFFLAAAILAWYFKIYKPPRNLDIRDF